MVSEDLKNWMDVKLVPAFDALGTLSPGIKPKPEVYATLLNSGCQDGEHAACFAELRRNFVNTRPVKLKNLILLVKHWFRQVFHEEAQSRRLPPVYALELLTIFAWEQGCEKDAFSLAQGFRSVLGLIQQYQGLRVFWTVNYSLEDPTVGDFLRRQLERPRPVILDPADPTWDLGSGTAWHWDVLAQEARTCCHHPCFLEASGSPVQPWEGLGLPRAGCSDLGHCVLRDSDQGTPADSRSLDDTVCHWAGDSRPVSPALEPATAASSASSALGAASASALAQVPARELDRFIQDHLQPNPRLQEQAKRAIEVLQRCLHKNCAYRPSRVIKGGSFGRGTNLRGGCDVELILFLNCFKNFEDQERHRGEILKEMRTQLASGWQDPVPGLCLTFPEQNTPGALQVQLVSAAPETWVNVSLLPAFDAVGQLGANTKPQPQVYTALFNSGGHDGQHAACFAELRRNFVNTRPAKLKNLILLVKHWYHHVAAQNQEQPGPSLPPAYALELLTIFAWEQGCKNHSFNMAQGLRTVLGLVQQYQDLCVYWTDNYGTEDPALRTHLLGQLRKPRPLILDPADPTWNVGQGSWELLAQNAAALETQACCMSGDRTPVPPWDVLPALLHQTPARDLDKFISRFLQPNRHFLAQVNKAVNTICSFLRENCFRNSPIKVLKVVKGGSSAKGTALRGRSDADIVVFLSCFSQFTEQGNKRAEIISEIRAQLEACQQEQQFEVKFEISKWENPRVLSFSLTSQTMLDHSVDFDVLPAFDALGQLGAGSRPPHAQVYRDLIRSYHCAGEFSTCFTELQRDFIVSRPTKLKSLIRLVKYWYQQVQGHKMPKGKGSLPPQHGLELLTVYAWEQGGQDPQFGMAEGFRTVLELITQYRQLRIYWTVNYSAEDETIGDFLRQQLQKPRPIILDPADPTGNLGHSARWDLLAKEAEDCMSALCCTDRDGTAIRPWPVRVLSSLGGDPEYQGGRVVSPRTHLAPGSPRVAPRAALSWRLVPAQRRRDRLGCVSVLRRPRGRSCAGFAFLFPSAKRGAGHRAQGRGQQGAMGNWESQVSSVPAPQLDEFVQRHLKPSEPCRKQIQGTVETICAALKEIQPFPVVQSVAMGGSYSRETVLRNHSDGTFVLFLDHLAKFQDHKKNQQEILDIIEQQLKARLLAHRLTAWYQILRLGGQLHIEVSTRWQTVSFQVLPAFNALGFSENPSPWIYRDLKRAMDETSAYPGEFSVCFAELRKKFFSKYPRKLKDLILLIKYWYQQCQKKWGISSLFSEYALELLTVYAWEQGCGAEDFDMAQGVRTVLGLIEQKDLLCVYWTVNYDFEDETVRNVLLQQLRSQRPVILDPADPTNNVSTRGVPWPRLKEEAGLWLSSLQQSGEAPRLSWNVLPAPLFMTPGHLLDKFIKDFLQPNKDFLDQLHRAVDDICTFLKEDCFRHSTTKVQKVIKGGSATKGTTLKIGSDADLVVFPSTLQSYTSQRNERGRVVQEIRRQLEVWQQKTQFEVTFEMSKWKAPRVLSFSLKSKNVNESVDFDVLPAFNALGQLHSGSTPGPQVYAGLIDLYRSSDLPAGEFSTCFTELQRNFIVSRPTKLKNLIRLMKHWYKQCERKLKSKGSLPPKYALELLTIYAWEQGCGSESFHTAEGFRTVLDLVTKYQQLCIFWNVNYNFEDETMRTFLLTQIQKTRPVILDPADPTGDVGGGDRWCWHLLAKEARQWLSSLCMRDGAGNPVQLWNVPTVQTPGSCGAGLYPAVWVRSRSILR
uniref:2'-5'-oligoadenylate synthase 3 n=1 Tax=Ictidomys tridecemlineatus TaxID=43179 RepID=UPI001A9D88FE|nr:2'-5'-oligoadenylate synthase 3 [Ictidomys tridecemlineatus]